MWFIKLIHWLDIMIRCLILWGNLYFLYLQLFLFSCFDFDSKIEFMNINYVRKRLGLLSLFVLLLFVFVCCRNNSLSWQRMDVAEKIMNEHPDSALVILDSINPSVLSGKEERARHALLLSMALDKNYIDTTTFDVLQPAIDYYLKKGTADQKLKTLYYQGRIYDNQGDHDKEMGCYLKAEEFMKDATDTMTVANLLVAQATIFHLTYKFDELIDYNLKAAELYSKVNRIDYQIGCTAVALSGCLMSQNKERADSVYNIFENLLNQHVEFKDEYVNIIISYITNFGTKEEIRNCLNNYNPSGTITDEFKLDLANGYCEIGDNMRGKAYLDSVSNNPELETTLKYLATKSFVLDCNGEYREALCAYKDFIDSLSTRHMDIFNQDLLFAQSRHEMEMSNLRETIKRKTA